MKTDNIYMKKIMLLLFVSLFLISFCSSYLPQEQDEPFNLTISSNNATACNLSYIQYNNGDSTIFNIPLTQNIRTFSTTINGTNFSELGAVCMHVVCTDGVTYEEGSQCREVTLSGKVVDGSVITADVALLIFFLLLMVGFFMITKDINLDKWNNSIINKYQNRNYIKLVLSSIVFNIIKNKFVVYYLFGLPILLLITDMIYTFNLVNMISIIQITFYIYLIGVTIVGLIFMSYVQEWLFDLLHQVRDMKWGTE